MTKDAIPAPLSLFSGGPDIRQPVAMTDPIIVALEQSTEPLCLICRASFREVGSLCRACFHEYDDDETREPSRPDGPDAHAA